MTPHAAALQVGAIVFAISIVVAAILSVLIETRHRPEVDPWKDAPWKRGPR